MKFSKRTPASLSPNPLTNLLRAKRKNGAPIVDLTESNPTRVGLDYPIAEIADALTGNASFQYSPQSKGLMGAREAVAEYYDQRGVTVDPASVVLTASTSEAYSLLFKLLCEAGETIAVPVPSYPLFEHLARAESVEPLYYSLELDGSWRIDFESLLETLEAGARAVVVVSPNNPTGSTLSVPERELLVRECGTRGVAIICDEVFADYASPSPSTMAGESRALTFTLSGLSKISALPQMKLGWIVVNGPAEAVDDALGRLEFLADLYLSVGTPVQIGLPRLLAIAPQLQRQIIERTRVNREWLEEKLREMPAIRIVSKPAGWYAVLQLPRLESEEDLVLRLLDNHNVLVHPGYFFDFQMDGLLVVSLITPESEFREGVARVLGA